MIIRSATPADDVAVYDICLKTGDAGQDATLLHSDARALGNIYTGPYLKLEPEFAIVLEGAGGVCGYCLGALDTPRFFHRFKTEWLPPLQRLHSDPVGTSSSWTPTQQVYHEYHYPDLYYPEPIEEYPSHLHIDLMPSAQGQGWGKQMVAELLLRLRGAGSRGVHLGMWARNERALGFYTAMGFRELSRVGEGERASLYLGMRW